jgi:hypothetical protein
VVQSLMKKQAMEMDEDDPTEKTALVFTPPTPLASSPLLAALCCDCCG